MDRRTYLRGVTGTLALSTTSLAGCLGKGQSETVFTWIPAPDALRQDGYRAFVTRPVDIGEYSENLRRSTMNQYEKKILSWDIAEPSPSPSDVDLYVKGSANIQKKEGNVVFIVAKHSLDTGMLASNIEQMGYSSAGTHRGFELYEHSEKTRTRALKDGVVLIVVDPRGSMNVTKNIIDASKNSNSNYRNADGDVAAVLEKINTEGNFWIEGYPKITTTVSNKGVFKFSTARGYSITLEQDRATATRVEYFTKDRKVGSRDVKNYINSSPLFNNAEKTDWTVDGRTLTINWQLDPANVSIGQLG